MGLGERLRRLDNRVLGLDRREAALATEAGWRRNAAQWRGWATAAGLMLMTGYLSAALDWSHFHGLIIFGGVMAFQAGTMKAEDDRLNRRGRMERLRPPGL